MTRHLILYVARSRTGRSRLGIVASRKVGNAVIRNRHKRLLREVFRLHQGTFQAPVDIMAIVKRDASPPAYRDYERDLLYGISKYFGRPRSAG
jgi:ribonuclease P protein component